MIKQSPSKEPQEFATKKVSIRAEINILGQNNIPVNEDQAKEILDFLYLIAKTYKLNSDD